MNFTDFAPIGLILVCMPGVAIAEYPGYISSAIRVVVSKMHSPVLLTFIVALVGVTSSTVSDVVHIILIPLDATSSTAVSHNPIVGAVIAFAASPTGFNSSLVLSIIDVLLVGISVHMVHFVDPEYVASPLTNRSFTVASSIMLALTITVATELLITKHVEKIARDDHVDHDAAEFTRPGASEEAAGGNAKKEKRNTAFSSSSSGHNKLTLSASERRDLRYDNIVTITFPALRFIALFTPGSSLRGEGDDVLNPVLFTDVMASAALFFAAAGIAYDVGTRTITSSADVPASAGCGLGILTTMMVLFFTVPQFTTYFEWSSTGQWTAIKDSESLTKADLPPLLLSVVFVLMMAILNLLIISGSAQWTPMAPIVVSMLMYVSVSLEASQQLFRTGDSPTNIITPISPYSALALAFLQRYYKPTDVGTLISLAIPYSLCILMDWFLSFVVWYFTGIPLGLEVPMR